jgi:guanylate kinase
MTDSLGLILYGPPGSGKDTVTSALLALSDQYSLFRRLKLDAPDQGTYRSISQQDLDHLRRRGALLYLNRRYGSTYAVDREMLDLTTASGKLPVLHLGQLAGIQAVSRYPLQWFTVLLWCPRNVTQQRVLTRGSTDIAQRLQAWDETLEDLTEHPLESFNRFVRTDRMSAQATATMIHESLQGPSIPKITIAEIKGDIK